MSRKLMQRAYDLLAWPADLKYGTGDPSVDERIAEAHERIDAARMRLDPEDNEYLQSYLSHSYTQLLESDPDDMEATHAESRRISAARRSIEEAIDILDAIDRDDNAASEKVKSCSRLRGHLKRGTVSSLRERAKPYVSTRRARKALKQTISRVRTILTMAEGAG